MSTAYAVNKDEWDLSSKKEDSESDLEKHIKTVEATFAKHDILSHELPQDFDEIEESIDPRLAHSTRPVNISPGKHIK